MYQLSAPRPLGANAAARRACAGVVSGRGGKGALPWWAAAARSRQQESRPRHRTPRSSQGVFGGEGEGEKEEGKRRRRRRRRGKAKRHSKTIYTNSRSTASAAVTGIRLISFINAISLLRIRNLFSQFYIYKLPIDRLSGCYW